VLSATEVQGDLLRQHHASSTTGDGLGMAARAGIPARRHGILAFHRPACRMGVLITEGVRGEGGYLLNKNAERFRSALRAERQGPASRDVVARAMATEIKEGAAAARRRLLLLKLDHFGGGPDREQAARHPRIARNSPNVDSCQGSDPGCPILSLPDGGIPANYLRRGGGAAGRGSGAVVPGLCGRRVRLCIGAWPRTGSEPIRSLICWCSENLPAIDDPSCNKPHT